MQKKLSKIINPVQQQIDPYQLISILNKKIKSQSQAIQWYKKMYQTSQYEKNITLTQLKKKKYTIQNLKLQFNQEKQQKKDYQFQLDQLRHKLNKFQKLSINTLKTPTLGNKNSLTLSLSPYSRNNSKQFISTNLRPKNLQKPLSTQLSLQLKQSEIYNILNPQHISRVLQEKNINSHQQFIPTDIKLFGKNHKASLASSSSQSFLNTSSQLMGQTADQPKYQTMKGQYFIQDFIVFGPDISQLKKKRQQNKLSQQFTIKPTVLYGDNIKTENQHVYTQVASRCFPFGAQVTKQFIESYQQIKSTIQFIPNNKLSEQCLISNLKGQQKQLYKSRCFKKCNLNQIQYVICLRIPQFICLAKDQKHYQRSQQQIWLFYKYYAIFTYYPIVDVHLNILNKIHTILMKNKLNKILLQNQKEKFYTFDIKRNLLDLDKNQQIKSILQHFKLYKPNLGDSLFFKNHYYGTIPIQSQAQYYLAKIAAPIFMTNFSFEQMLLLVIAILCQKSIVFISKHQSIASLCALFLINILYPFPYLYRLLLNVDQQKMSTIVFQYPFPVISTLKKTTQNLHQIISEYAAARIQKKDIKQESQKMIFVDIDTNSIFYQGHQTFQPLILMGRPQDEFMKEYMKVNSSYSKSFSFPKKMQHKKQSEQVRKRQQQKNKMIEDIQNTIKSHTTKLPSFEMTSQINKTLKMLINYVRSFVIDGKQFQQATKNLTNGQYVDVLRKPLLQRHPNKGQLIQKIISSQYYADFLHLFSDQNYELIQKQ